MVKESLQSCGGEGGNHRTLCLRSIPSLRAWELRSCF